MFDKKILLVDFSNIAWATFHTNTKVTKDKSLSPDQVKQHWKYLMLNSLLKLKTKHNPNELIICIDSPSWRHKYFKFYKARRALQRKKSGMDYEAFHEVIDELCDELREYFPYKVVRAEHAEADDIIAVLANTLAGPAAEIVIASRDKDFKQLLHSGVSLWDTHAWKWVRCNNPKTFLIKHILMGDAGDDIPNIRSDSDTFITEGKRQKPCGPVMVEKILGEFGLQEWIKDEGLLQNWKRNKRLIRLSKATIPDIVWNNVLEAYAAEEDKKGNYMLLAKYFGINRMRRLQKSLDQFL